MDAISDFTNAGLLHTLPIHASPRGNSGSRCTSPSSALSSAPSGLLTPTIGTSTGEAEYTGSTLSERRIYERRRKVRNSWVYFPENGSEYTTGDGKIRWRCSRSKFLPLTSPSSTRISSQ